MIRSRFDGLCLFLLGVVLFIAVGVFMERSSIVAMVDFKSLYYGSRCLIQHADPYQKSELLVVYHAESSGRFQYPQTIENAITIFINLPTVFIFAVPLGMLAWGPAHLLWMVLTATIFVFAAYLTWNLSAVHTPILAGGLLCIFLLNSELLLEIGNIAGIAIGLCVIGAWCFLEDRFVRIGILCLAASLAIKPHVAFPVWLYFFLAKGYNRKYTIQTIAVVIALSVPAMLLVTSTNPNWISELRSNLEAASLHGAPNDPGPASVNAQTPGAIIIDLQSALSLIRDDPRFYNSATYVVCAPLLVIWVVATLRRRFDQQSARLALAAIAPLSMLPLYHRTMMLCSCFLCSLDLQQFGEEGARPNGSPLALLELLQEALASCLRGFLLFTPPTS